MFCHETFTFTSEEEAQTHMIDCTGLALQIGNESHEFTINKPKPKPKLPPLPTITGIYIAHKSKLETKQDRTSSLWNDLRQSISSSKVTANGLENSLEWHRKPTTLEKFDLGVYDPHSRSILVQTSSNLNQLDQTFLEPRNAFLPGGFGENIFIEDNEILAVNKVCVGDVFAVCRPATGTNPFASEEEIIRLTVTSPRRPCGKVDVRFSKIKFTSVYESVRAQSCKFGYAGFFCRVSGEGEIKINDVIRRVKNPHPNWSLTTVSTCLYGADSFLKDYNSRAIRAEEWMGTDEELEELSKIDELAFLEWGEEVETLLTLRADKKTMAQVLLAGLGVGVGVLAAYVAKVYNSKI